MNGSIGVESSPGIGSTFSFTVPLELRSPSPVETLRDELLNVDVLIVDDACQIRQILQGYVESWGMRSQSVTTAREALQSLRQAYVNGAPFKIAIINSILSDKNGVELATDIFNDPAISTTKLILLTAFDTPGVGNQLMPTGFHAQLAQPVRRSHLLESIVAACSSSEAIMSRAAENMQNKTASKAVEHRELILIVEDYPVNQQVAQLYLTELGFASHIASNGNEALKALSQNHYALVLMDCQMPELDGFAATEAIRKQELGTGHHIPIIAMTALAMAGDRERCLSSGMDDYVSKPVDPEQLRRTIYQWLQHDQEAIDHSQESTAVHSYKTPGEHPIDLEALNIKYGSAGQTLLKQFLTDGPQDLTKLQQALHANDGPAFLRTVHGFKGICGAVYATKLRTTCVDIENAARDGNWRTIPASLRQMEIELRELQEFLKWKSTN